MLIPSLINPPHILDLDADVSLAGAIAAMGRTSIMLDWGPAEPRAALDVAGHVEHLLLPLLRSIGAPTALIGYCLGGTMAIGAAGAIDCERVVTLAAPWRFDRYPRPSKDALREMWTQAKPAAKSLCALPMEVLQAAFWSLDPGRVVAKFADFSRLDPSGPQARRFVMLEDWANEGDALPYPAARELIEDMFGSDFPGTGRWMVGGKPAKDQLPVPLTNFTAAHDRIAPAATAPAGDTVALATGHVGMIVGSARIQLHEALRQILVPCR